MAIDPSQTPSPDVPAAPPAPQDPHEPPAAPDPPDPPPAPDPHDPPAFDDPAEEADFQAAQQLLLHPPPPRRKTLLLVLSIAAFALVSLTWRSDSLVDLALLLGVLLVHELGHAIGMRAFGYQDVQIFFIPLFGAAAAGRARGVSRTKQAIVLLLGPLPGIVAGGALAWLGGPPWVRTAAILLIVVNALNLLPVEPLDGGRLFQVLVFSRHRYPELVFRVLTALTVVGVSLYFEQWVFAVIGYFILVATPQRARLLAAAARLSPLGWPDDPERLDDAQRRTLYRTAWSTLPQMWQVKWRGKPAPQASIMDQLLARATQPPPSTPAVLGLIGVWLVGLALAVAGLAIVAGVTPRWHRYTSAQGAFEIDLPGQVEAHLTGSPSFLTTTDDGPQYIVSWFPEATLEATRATIVEQAGPPQGPALPAGEYRIPKPGGGHQLVKLVAGGNGLGYMLLADPDEGARTRRVLDSFVVRGRPGS